MSQALHWSHFPRDSEMQIMFKFVFPQGTIPDPVFRDFAHSAKESFDFEYDYEWKSGIFLRHELVCSLTSICSLIGSD